MPFSTSLTVAAAVAAAGFTVAGCAASSSSSPSGATASTAGSPKANPSAPAPASASSTAPGSSTASPQAAGTCKAPGLRYALGAKSGSGGQVIQAVDLTNTGSSVCSMAGFPGVDLVGWVNGQQNFTWSLVRQSAYYSTVTLQPGATAHFNLFYLPGAVGHSGGMDVLKMVITPPNDYTQAELTWNQLVVLQDGATHPGTYISPVMPGA
jgi:hypothetical protein